MFPESFKKNGKAVSSYAFPFFVIGTAFLFAGMFFSAVIIERSSKEYIIKPKVPSKIYWLQPGNQDVGDQIFGAFLAAKEGPDSKMTTDLQYIKSIRDHRFDTENTRIYSTVLSTLFGFIFQFVGLRGLHASVILASVGATFVMSVVRTCLRAERMAPDENRMFDEKGVTSHKQQELDFFAFHFEGIKSLSLIAGSSCGSVRLRDDESLDSLKKLPQCPVATLIRRRAQLSRLTSSPGCGKSVPWDDIPIRTTAHSLAKAIETTMDLLSAWGTGLDQNFDVHLVFECHYAPPQLGAPIRGAYTISLQRQGDALKWKADVHDLEAILGLWTWSLSHEDDEWDEKHFARYRLLGLDKDEASQLETFLCFHKWIFREAEASMAPSERIDTPRRRFGFVSEKIPFRPDILVVETENKLETLAAQDVYIEFLQQVFPRLDELGGTVDVRLGVFNKFRAESSRIDDLALCFGNAGLGSREDALLCIVPVLRAHNLLPELSADSTTLRQRIKTYVERNDWKTALRLVHWICERSVGLEFERSVYQLGDLLRRALLSADTTAVAECDTYIRAIVGSDIRRDFLDSHWMLPRSIWPMPNDYHEWWRSFAEQICWIVHQVGTRCQSKHELAEYMQKHYRESIKSSRSSQSMDATRSEPAMREWLTIESVDPDREYCGHEDELGFQWALRKGYYALLYSSLARCVEVGERFPSIIQHAYIIAAKIRSDWCIEALQRFGADINTLDERDISALMEAAATGHIGAIQTLLKNGANPNGSDKVPSARPLLLSARHGFVEIADLLLKHGALLNAEDRLGQTALHMAVQEDQLDMARFLLGKGISTSHRDLNGRAALHLAVEENQTHMVELLCNMGADPTSCESKYGLTPLMIAIKSSHVRLVRFLMDGSAWLNLHAQDHEGLTALDWATRKNCQTSISIISEALNRDEEGHSDGDEI